MSCVGSVAAVAAPSCAIPVSVPRCCAHACEVISDRVQRTSRLVRIHACHAVSRHDVPMLSIISLGRCCHDFLCVVSLALLLLACHARSFCFLVFVCMCVSSNALLTSICPHSCRVLCLCVCKCRLLHKSPQLVSFVVSEATTKNSCAAWPEFLQLCIIASLFVPKTSLSGAVTM